MKFDSLILKNFLNHRETSIKLGHINIFAGENGTGKTAIKDAVLFALTGITRRNPVNFGTKSCEVELKNGDWQILRKETASGGKTFAVSNGKGAIGGTNTEIQEKFLNQIGLTAAQVDAMLSTGRFLDMSANERKEVIFRALGVEVNRENLLGWLTRQDKETDWEKIIGEVEKENGFEFNSDSNQKTFTERRRAAKREKEAHEERMRRFDDLPAPDVKKRIDAENLLADLEGQAKALYEQRGQQRAVTQLKTEFEAVKAELSKPDNSDKIKRLSDDLGEAEKNLETARANKEPLLSEKAGLEAELKALQSFEALGDSCDRCGQKVDEKTAKKLATANQNKIKGTAKRLKEANKSLNEVIQYIAEYEESVRDIKRIIEELRLTHYQGDRKALEKRHDELQAMLKESAAPENLEADIQTLEARITKGRELVTKLKAAENADKERAELEESIALAEAEIKQFDLLEKAYSPKGVKSDLLREKLDSFQAAANEMLQAVNLGSLEIITEQNGKEVFEVMVNGLPEPAYSRAQRWAIAIALQGALTQFGLKVLCVDDVDMFVGNMKSLANKMISANKDKFDTILIFRASDERPVVNGGNGIKYFWLHGRGVEAI